MHLMLCYVFYEVLLYVTADVINKKMEFAIKETEDLFVSKQIKMNLADILIEILNKFNDGFGLILLVNFATLTIFWILFWYKGISTVMQGKASKNYPRGKELHCK